MSFLRFALRVNMGAMATKKPSSEPVDDKPQGSGEKQKAAPDPLPESEWAFHKVAKDQLRYCAMWELARLCGNKQKPWRDLPDEAKARFILREQLFAGCRQQPDDERASAIRLGRRPAS